MRDYRQLPLEIDPPKHHLDRIYAEARASVHSDNWNEIAYMEIEGKTNSQSNSRIFTLPNFASSNGQSD